MAKYERKIKGDFNTVVAELNKAIMDSGISMNLVDQSNDSMGNTHIAIRVYDKYFMRNKSRASLSVSVLGHEGDVLVTAIGAGGGQGMFFNYSLGAETEMVEVVQKCIDGMVL